MRKHKIEISRGQKPREQLRLLHDKLFSQGCSKDLNLGKWPKTSWCKQWLELQSCFPAEHPVSILYFLKIIYFILCAWVFLPPRLCGGTGSSGTGVPDRCKRSCGCWELNFDPLEGQSVTLTYEPSLQPLCFKILRLLALFAKLTWQIFL